MFLTILILSIIPIAILLESFFIGKYFSISNDIFKSNEYATFSFGFIIYFAISFIIFLPFSFIGIGKNYFLIIMIIKDLFIIIFLISRSYVFKKMKINLKLILILLVSSIILILFEEVILSFRWKFKKTVNNDIFKTFWNYLTSISSVFKIPLYNVYTYSILPVAAIGIVAIFGSVIFMFIPRYNIKSFIAIFITSTLGFVLFNGKVGLIGFLGLSMLLFLIYCSYNLFIYSRRRYATVFAMTAIVIWSINDKYFMAMLLVAIISSMLYVLYKKPNALQFSLQILFPLLILSSIWIYNYSAILAFITALVTFIAYFILFYFGNHEKIFSFTRKINLYNIIILLFTISVIIWAVVQVFIGNNDLDESNIALFPILNELDAIIWPKILIYSLYVFLIVVMVYRIFKKNKYSEFNFYWYFAFLSIVFEFNPLIMNAVKNTIINQFYVYINFIVFMPIFILIVSKILQKIKIA